MTDHPEDQGKALAMLLMGACVIGVGPVLVRLSETGPAAAGFWRLLFALPLLAVIAQKTGGGIGKAPRAAAYRTPCRISIRRSNNRGRTIAYAIKIGNINPRPTVASKRFVWAGKRAELTPTKTSA